MRPAIHDIPPKLPSNVRQLVNPSRRPLNSKILDKINSANSLPNPLRLILKLEPEQDQLKDAVKAGGVEAVAGQLAELRLGDEEALAPDEGVEQLADVFLHN
jgi:hypothetical protein